ncbi:hypothetical protein GCM10010329_14240 [Streptomyces spiroverticillatus]|uniref:Uncharacterized protein n=1 Tax=Streptomyces finlayi TaxID=67296 RepID=A0A919CCV2_9ACTN|nr:hypothetical protein [Streptomyces finlayi]GGZ94178.1 hypothetical protein GCM10010329_14240 [Streptomyces spiroverticillatus]GHD06614.1 hypothetical protein GCM10010334_58270 [Streptomyces finlayi]
MGAARHTRITSTARHAWRGVALLCAATALLGALLACLSPTGAGGEGVGPHRESPAATAYNCPYDDSGCGAFPHLAPAVLTAPPQDSAPGTAVLVVRHARGDERPRVRRAVEVRARAPGAHVLGVLRR